MNTQVTERERRLALALAEELALVIGALLNQTAAARDVREAEGPCSGWLLRWRLGGPVAGALAAAIDETAAGEIARHFSDPTAPPSDETVGGGLREVAGQVAVGLNRNAAVDGASVTVDGPPTLEALEPGAAAMTFEIVTSEGFQMSVTCRATLNDTSSDMADERGARVPATTRGAEAPADERGPRVPATTRGAGAPAAAPANLGVILDLDLPLVVRFAQTSLTLQALSRLGPGSVLDLDRSPEDAVDVLVNGVAIARGEVVVVAGNYGVRITEVLNAAERIRVMAS